MNCNECREANFLSPYWNPAPAGTVSHPEARDNPTRRTRQRGHPAGTMSTEIRYYADRNHLSIAFGEKPSDATIAAVKSAGLTYKPREWSGSFDTVVSVAQDLGMTNAHIVLMGATLNPTCAEAAARLREAGFTGDLYDGDFANGHSAISADDLIANVEKRAARFERWNDAEKSAWCRDVADRLRATL